MIKDKISDVIELIKGTDINGCITGSSMLDEDFDLWDSAPDVDVFVYTEPELLHAVDLLTIAHGFKPSGDGEKWKIEKQREGKRGKNFLTTLKVEKDGVIVNLTYKKDKTNLFNVLSSFDMSIIMVGFDIKSQVLLDLRCAWPGMVKSDPTGKWSPSPEVAYPNPLRKQDVDMYGVEMWVRQFDRVIKYWSRGFDTRPMARFYIELINGVLEKGQLFRSEASERAYTEFMAIYEPLRDKMVKWLEEKEEAR